jgi:hypothetical protein
MIVDLYLVYSFIRRLATPFNEWEAYKLGIIDDKGTVLRKRKTLVTREEKRAFGIFDVMILNLKKLLAKIPGGSSRIASYAAALYLIREWNHFSDSSLLQEDLSDNVIEESMNLFYDRYVNYIIEANVVNKKMHNLDTLFESFFDEDAPTVSAGSGNIAGIGVGDDGEPGFTRRQAQKYKKSQSVLRRKMPVVNIDEDEVGTSGHVATTKKLRYKKLARPTKPAIPSAIASTG